MQENNRLTPQLNTIAEPEPPVYDTPDMAPKELESFIHEKGIIGQNEAVKAASLIVYRHFVMNCASVNLFCGPTGSGKTQIWRVLAHEFPYVHLFDSSTLSNDGWRGTNKISYQFKAIRPQLREMSILVFDEFDKLLEPKTSAEMNVTETLQNELLKLFDHDILYFGPDRAGDEPMTVNCRNVSIILLGAFENLLKAKSRKPVSVGFDGQQRSALSYETTEITLDDLLAFTQIRPEIAGRIDRIVSMKPLGYSDYFRILLNYVDELYRRTGSLFTIDPAALQAIARAAVSKPLGARWAIHRVNRIIDDLVYEKPFDYNYVYLFDPERTVI